MSMSDPLADMLTRIRNAIAMNHKRVVIPHSVIKGEIAALLKEEGFVENFKIVRSSLNRHNIEIGLKYYKGKPAIYGLKRVSRPGLRVYKKSKDIPSVFSGLGVAIMSTSKGILSDKEARLHKVGGEILCYIW
ncbi:MAG: 30S ribosomal protein S8 [Nitrospinota bacterium]